MDLIIGFILTLLILGGVIGSIIEGDFGTAGISALVAGFIYFMARTFGVF